MHAMGAVLPAPNGRPLSIPSSHASVVSSDEEKADENEAASNTNKKPSSSYDHVRWLIDRQSFNGAWIFDDQEVSQLTNGKSFSSIKTTGNRSRDVVTTALAIAVLESKHVSEKNLWQIVVGKARKQLEREGLSKDQINALVEEIKKQL